MPERLLLCPNELIYVLQSLVPHGNLVKYLNMRLAKVPDDANVMQRNTYNQIPQTDSKDIQ